MLVHPDGVTRTIYEFGIAGKSYGDTISSATNHWDWTGSNSINGNAMDVRGFSIDADDSTILWTMGTQSYHGGSLRSAISQHVLNNDNTWTTTHDKVGLEGIDSNRIFGGTLKVPTYFKDIHNCPDYMSGWGGYVSGYGQSMGLAAYMHPNISGYADNTDIPDTEFVPVAEHAEVHDQADDWYEDGSNPTTYDRGVRYTGLDNYIAEPIPPVNQQRLQWTGTCTTNGTTVTWVSGLTGYNWHTSLEIPTNPLSTSWWLNANNGNFNEPFIINGVSYVVASITSSTVLELTTSAGVQSSPVAYQTPPTRPWYNPPTAQAQWQSPAPDGRNRFTNGDTYGGVSWIYGATKHGIVTDASLAAGYVWYADAIICKDSQAYELQIFDPDDIADAYHGNINTCLVQPQDFVVHSPQTAPDPDPPQPESCGTWSTYDATAKILYVLFRQPITGHNLTRLYAFSVNV
jgi:hypothetical protein